MIAHALPSKDYNKSNTILENSKEHYLSLRQESNIVKNDIQIFKDITEKDLNYHIKKYGCKPSDYYKYCDEKGNIYYSIRWDLMDKGKIFHPYIFCNLKNKWISEGFPIPYPLYNLTELIEKPDNTVLIVEGEKTVKAAKQLFPNYTVITSSSGALAANKTDWSILKGRDIIIAPDHDAAGIKYSLKVIDLCRDLVKSIRFLKPETLGKYIIKDSNLIERNVNVPKGYDLADSLEEGWTAELIKRAMNNNKFVPFFNLEECEQKILSNKDEELIGKEFKLIKNELLYKVKIKENDDQTSSAWLPLCGHLRATYQVRDSNSNNWGTLLEFYDSDNKKKEIIIHRAQLTTDKAALEILLNNGLEVSKIKKFYGPFFTHDLINEYINISKPKKRAILVDKVGWHANCYVMPYINNPKNCYSVNSTNETSNFQEEYILTNNTSNPRRLERRGTLEGWQNDVGILAVDNTILIFVIAAALTAPLMKMLGEDGCCFHFSGNSSIGKTTALYVANTVWGMDKPSSFRTTDNAAESLCKNSNDGLLVMDELAEIDPNSLEKITYLFGNGSGKGRSKKNGDAQAITTFTILGLSTGEIGLQAKLAEKGKSTTAGQNVRFIEILADRGQNLGIFDTIHNFESSRALSDHFRKEAKNTGVVIDEFMKCIVTNLSGIKEKLLKLNEIWLNECLPSNIDPQIERVAKKFALIAAIGEFAIKSGILPFEEASVGVSCKILFNEWVEQRGGNHSHEFQAIVQRLKTLTQENINSRFLNSDGTDESKNIKDIAGYKKLNNNIIVEFWINPTVFVREILQNRNPKIFYKQLIEAGYIIPDKDGVRTQNKRAAKESGKRFIVVSANKVNE